MPRMTFTAGNDALASEVNTYLMDQAVMTFASASARSTAISSPTEGMISYLNDVNRYEANHGGATWYPVAGQMPYLELTKATTQSITSGSETKITFPTSIQNRGGFTIASDVVTVPTTGVYDINAALYYPGNSSGYRLTRIYINGTLTGNDYVAPSATADLTLRSVITKYLTAGDTIEIRTLQNSGSTLAIQVNGTRLTVRYVCP